MARRSTISSARRSSHRRNLTFDRLRLVGLFCLLISVTIGARLAQVQVAEHQYYKDLASTQHELAEKIIPKRGEIYAQDRYAENGLAALATNQPVYTVFVNPQQFHTTSQSSAEVATALAPLLGIKQEVILSALEPTDDVYEPLKSRASEQEVAALDQIISDHHWIGIDWLPEPARLYPEKNSTASITGFLGFSSDGVTRIGQYGLEEAYNTVLAGTPGSVQLLGGDPGGLTSLTDPVVEAQSGSSLILTIDRNIQYQACQLLEKQVKAQNAKKGTLIVMDPKTGKILALCNAPSYDPNQYMNVDGLEVYLNDAVSDQWEPGSVFKAFAVAAAMNDGMITPNTTYTDTGSVEVAGTTIQNALRKAYGVVDMTFVLQHSLNTGSIFAVQQIGAARWAQYVEAFGFGKVTGSEFSGELPGDISQLETGEDVYSYNISFGQGLTVTPIQLIQAYGALANNGTMMKPYIVDRIVQPEGGQIVTEPVVVGQPISADTARTITAMLVKVVDSGTGVAAALPNYFVAGKTGTAQIPLEDGSGYDPVRHKDTFVGYFPVADPQIVILVKIDEPQVSWAEESVTSVFGSLGQFIAQYLQISPDRRTSE